MPNADSVSTDSFLWVQFKNFLRSSDKKSNDQLFRVSNDAQVQTRRPVVIFIEGKEHLKIIDGFFYMYYYCPITGQLFTLGNPSDVPGADLVADQDVVVVTLAYRYLYHGAT